MRKILLLIALLSFQYAKSQSVTVVHINAEFNSTNDWDEIKNIEGAKLMNGYIDKKPAIKDAYDIRYVPTIIVFSNGKEVKRWEAGLDMKLHVRLEDVQYIVDTYK